MSTDSPQDGRVAGQIWGQATQPSNMPMLCHKGTVTGRIGARFGLV